MQHDIAWHGNQHLFHEMFAMTERQQTSAYHSGTLSAFLLTKPPPFASGVNGCGPTLSHVKPLYHIVSMGYAMYEYILASDLLIRGCTLPQKYQRYWLALVTVAIRNTYIFKPPGNKVWCQTRVYSATDDIANFVRHRTIMGPINPLTQLEFTFLKGRKLLTHKSVHLNSIGISLSWSTPRAEVIFGGPFQWPYQFNPLFASYNQTMGKTLVWLKRVHPKIWCLQTSCVPLRGNVMTSPILRQQPRPVPDLHVKPKHAMHPSPLPSPVVWSFQPRRSVAHPITEYILPNPIPNNLAVKKNSKPPWRNDCQRALEVISGTLFPSFPMAHCSLGFRLFLQPLALEPSLSLLCLWPQSRCPSWSHAVQYLWR